MAQVGVVTQTGGGMVYQCSLAEKCKTEHGLETIPGKKQCLLSVDHGDRCQAWDNQKFTWLIHTDPNRIQQL
ncbi:hypothetical protein GZH47_32605 (plasmid) [Paenibacillus rhizovicinus]|uniref:Uncharacterized protein n=1 Tax=Paenibacillus rhizovicinus TaxID=2704463 RepID=A0A6C0PB87_9BACL|nr:hypothetical protein [Paenibacillus rhizovicinus]QHW35641.1 hypothetical protein GZH47_32605 [Paenibacillus rhizovicinus]